MGHLGILASSDGGQLLTVDQDRDLARNSH
jgi:hypothetical protein